MVGASLIALLPDTAPAATAVAVYSGRNKGTGTAFQNGPHALVWTAAHVLDYKIKAQPTIELTDRTEYKSIVVRMSKKHDLALLLITDRPPLPPLPSLDFWSSDEPPPPGTRLTLGAEYRDRIDGTDLDPVLYPAIPGESGSGLFTLTDDKYVGMIVLSNRYSKKLCWITPAETIIDFANKMNCRWAVSSAPAPDTIYPLFIGE